MRVECGEVLKPLFKLLQIFYVPYYGRCRNLPFGGCTKRPYHGPKRLSPREKMSGVATNVYSKKTLEKPKKDEGLHILKMRVQESFMHGKGISTPRVCHKGRQSLIECANHDFNIIYFPFYHYFPFLYFLLFWGRQGCFPRSYVSSGAMRKSNQRSSLSMKFCGLHCFFFYIF